MACRVVKSITVWDHLWDHPNLGGAAMADDVSDVIKSKELRGKPAVRISVYSDTALRAALPPAGKGGWSDPGQPGLHLRGNQSGARWSLRVRAHGQRVRIALGAWPGLSNDAAREVARTRLASMAMAEAAGVDPIDQLQEGRAKKTRIRQAPTLLEIFERSDISRLTGPARRDTIARSYWHSHMTNLRNGPKRGSEIARLLAPFWHQRPGDIQAAKLIAHLEAEKLRAPAQTSAILRTLRPAWRWMARSPRHWTEDHLTEVRPVPDRERTRDLTLGEMACILVASEKQPGIRGHLIRTLALTAARRGDVADMTLGEVNFATSTWTIPRSRAKTGVDYVVPLSPLACADIEAAAELSTATEPHHYIFAGRSGPSAPYNGFSALASKLRKDVGSGLEPWVLHDFRAAFMGRMLDARYQLHIIDRCLNHMASQSVSKIQSHYLRTDMIDERREIMDAWAKMLDDAITVERGDNIVSLTHA
jgi:integrase